jgi:uncharacterized protein YjbI with pentapeptide repeats
MTMQEAEGARVIIGELLKRIALADRLAEAAKEVLRFVGGVNCSGYKCRLPQCSDCNMQAESEQPAVSEVEEALAAFRSPEPQPEGVQADIEQASTGGPDFTLRRSTMALNETLRLHGLWLSGDPEGARANLTSANLTSANLRYANLRYANLNGADLRYANLNGADLRGAMMGDDRPPGDSPDEQPGCGAAGGGGDW